MAGVPRRLVCLVTSAIYVGYSDAELIYLRVRHLSPKGCSIIANTKYITAAYRNLYLYYTL